MGSSERCKDAGVSARPPHFRVRIWNNGLEQNRTLLITCVTKFLIKVGTAVPHSCYLHWQKSNTAKMAALSSTCKVSWCFWSCQSLCFNLLCVTESNLSDGTVFWSGLMNELYDWAVKQSLTISASTWILHIFIQLTSTIWWCLSGSE